MRQEAQPAGSRLDLGARAEERQATADAGDTRGFVVIQEMPASGWLGPLAPGDRVLLWRESCARHSSSFLVISSIRRPHTDPHSPSYTSPRSAPLTGAAAARLACDWAKMAQQIRATLSQGLSEAVATAVDSGRAEGEGAESAPPRVRQARLGSQLPTLGRSTGLAARAAAGMGDLRVAPRMPARSPRPWR